MPKDKLELLIDAHDIFNKFSIHEVIDLPRHEAIEVMNELYDNRDSGDVERYLDVVDRIRINCMCDA